jgi:hypothetical protein
MFASDEVVWASRRFNVEEKIPSLRRTKEVIGVYLTTGACMHFYKNLDRLEERAIYFDTDSVLYIKEERKTRLVEIWDNLGDMTDELKSGEYIDEFVSGGTKNYATHNLQPRCLKEPQENRL